jgi:hypothetical protein
MSITRSAATLLVVAGLGAALSAQAPALGIRFGLWEQTVEIKMDGVPGIDTSKMTPEQVAQMKAMLKTMVGKPITQQTCMTKEDFASDKFMLEDQPGMKCTRVVTTNTKTSYAATFTCTGTRQMTGQVNVEATGDSAFKGTMKASTTDQGKATTMNMAMSGKWLAAACGDVK